MYTSGGPPLNVVGEWGLLHQRCAFIEISGGSAWYVLLSIQLDFPLGSTADLQSFDPGTIFYVSFISIENAKCNKQKHINKRHVFFLFF